jgi:type IV pilus assembly protein PilX
MKTSLNNHRNFRRQQGVVLFISLIMLVAMTLAGIALIRSVDTANLIAGNLAFRQGATLAADSGEEAARTWLLTQNTATLSGDCLNPPTTCPTPTQGYYSGAAPVPSWEQFDWQNLSVALPAADAAGNQVNYVIHRLCAIPGSPTGAGNNCLTTTTAGGGGGSSKGAGEQTVSGTAVYYYRVTSRVLGPRNTASYVQTLITV